MVSPMAPPQDAPTVSEHVGTVDTESTEKPVHHRDTTREVPSAFTITSGGASTSTCSVMSITRGVKTTVVTSSLSTSS